MDSESLDFYFILMQCNAFVMHTLLSAAVAGHPFLSRSCSTCWAACEAVPQGPTWRHSHLMEPTPVSRLDAWPEAKLGVAAALAVPCRSSRAVSVASTPGAPPSSPVDSLLCGEAPALQ